MTSTAWGDAELMAAAGVKEEEVRDKSHSEYETGLLDQWELGNRQKPPHNYVLSVPRSHYIIAVLEVEREDSSVHSLVPI